MVDNLIYAFLVLYSSMILGESIQNEILRTAFYIICLLAFLFSALNAAKKEKRLLKRIENMENKRKENEHMYDFRTVKGHVEIYYNGEFLCTADNMDEALKDAEAHAKGEL